MSTALSQVEQFKALVNGLREALREPEQFTLSYAAESSAFVRFGSSLPLPLEDLLPVVDFMVCFIPFFPFSLSPLEWGLAVITQ